MDKIKKLIAKKNKSKIVSLTAYSKNIASILDNYCDLVLVGDSLGSVLYNYKSTRQVTLDMMIEHSKSVRMGVKKALMVVDMPHNTYRNPKEAFKNAKKIISKTKCDAVKLEGGKKIYNSIQTLVKNKIPVMGHIGVLPQSDKTFKFKGKKKSEREKILKDAKLLQRAGVFSIVLECVETSLAKYVTKQINIPTIGIGASNNCDGQILVFDDAEQENAINGITAGIFGASGQSCIAGSRLYIQKGIYDEFLDKLSKRASKIKIGAPMDAETEMGPLSSFKQLEVIEKNIKNTIDQGGKIKCGGKRDSFSNKGYYFPPTIIECDNHNLPVAENELFGPVLSLSLIHI